MYISSTVQYIHMTKPVIFGGVYSTRPHLQPPHRSPSHRTHSSYQPRFPSYSCPIYTSVMSPPPIERVTRSNRSNFVPQPPSRSSASASQAAKKRKRREEATCENNVSPDLDALPTPRSTQQPIQSSSDTRPLELSELNLYNYHLAKKDWPLGRIQAQLAKQKSSNHQLSAAVIAEGQAHLEELEHTLHMLAMVSGVGIKNIKHSLSACLSLPIYLLINYLLFISLSKGIAWWNTC